MPTPSRAAATVVPSSGLSALITNSTTPWNTDGRSYGWRFFVTKPIVITHIGVFAMHRDYSGTLVDNGLNGAHQMGIWGVRRASAGGGLQLLRGPLTIGPGRHGGGSQLRDMKPVDRSPFLMTPNDPTYERWLIGVWTGNNNTDLFYHYPVGGMTIECGQAGVIQFQNFTLLSCLQHGCGELVRFRGAMGSDAGQFRLFRTEFQVRAGGAEGRGRAGRGDLHVRAGPHDDCRARPRTPSRHARCSIGGWRAPRCCRIGPLRVRRLTGNANLSLAAPVPALAIGAHTLTLEVTDGTLTASDTMVLTVENTPPEAQPAPTSQVRGDQRRCDHRRGRGGGLRWR